MLRPFPNCPLAAIARNSDETSDETVASAVSFNVERAAEESKIWLDPVPWRQIKIADKSDFLKYIDPP